jgi:thymidylate synthase (FAD)
MKHDPLNDGISSVELIDHMGSDLTVVNAARVSMAKESDWDFGDSGFDMKLSKRDCGLIAYLAKHNHWTPFSHPQVQLRIKMPIFVARQWFKHMIGFTRNEVSRRYVDDTPELYFPTEWRKRAENVKQGSSDELLFGGGGSLTYDLTARQALDTYKFLIDSGVCPEQARMTLPQSMYTEFYETGSLAAYARLAKLRLDPHAQKEVRQYAHAVSEIMGELFPVSWAHLT